MSGNTRFAVSVHMLAYLAYKGEASATSAEIASSVDTHPVVIRRLLAALVKARLVKAQKGAAGGFSLASTPENISLLDLHRAVEPPTEQSLNRFKPNTKCPVGAKIEHILAGIFFKVRASTEAELAQVTLADVARQLHTVCPRKS